MPRISPLQRVLCAAVLCAAASAGQAQAPAPPRALTDEQFIESLGQRYSGGELDRSRLARLFYGAAATLDGNKSTLQYLQSRLSGRGSQTVPAALATQYDVYGAAVSQFQTQAMALLDDPASVTTLFRVLSSGLRSCAELDGYARLLEAYGVGSGDLASVLASIEACDRFRRAAFQPRVEGLVLEVLASESFLRRELDALRREIGELERLLEDLRRIDAPAP